MNLGDVLLTLVDQAQWASDSAENTWQKLEAQNAVEAALTYLNVPAGEVPVRPFDGAVPAVDLSQAAAVAQQLQQAIAALMQLQAQQAAPAAAAAPAAQPADLLAPTPTDGEPVQATFTPTEAPAAAADTATGDTSTAGS